jgi:hypothetical protein
LPKRRIECLQDSFLLHNFGYRYETLTVFGFNYRHMVHCACGDSGLGQLASDCAKWSHRGRADLRMGPVSINLAEVPNDENDGVCYEYMKKFGYLAYDLPNGTRPVSLPELKDMSVLWFRV